MFFLFFFTLLLLSRHHCAEVYDISPSQPLSEGQTLVSPGQVFELGFFSPNNNSGNNKYVGMWHKSIFPRKVVWVANREKPIAASGTLASMRISTKGNLELVDGKQNSLWSTNISVPSNGSAAALLDSGNFVVKDDNVGSDPLWQSFDYPCDTLLPNRLLGFDSKSGKTNVLTSWKSESDPSTGMFFVGLTPEVPSQALVWISGSKTPYWRTGPWDKSKFIGIPSMNDGYLNGKNLDDNMEEGKKYFYFNFMDNTSAYLDVSSDGRVKFMYSVHGENWNLDWVGQKNSCDKYAVCGSFAVCKASESPTTPICECLKGFLPKSHEEWSQGNRAGGCVRQTKLFCETNTSQSVTSRRNKDGFLRMMRLKVPDFHEYITSSDAEECKTQCLNNCSCLAYAYVNNIGCLVWSKDLIDIQEFAYGGEDLFIRVDRSELGEGKPTKLIAGLTAICFLSIFGVIAFGLHRLRAKEKAQVTRITENARDTLQEYIRKHDPSELFIYSFDSILIATDNFSSTNKLGEGGFGPVYKGKLQEGKEIAVKRLSSSSGQGIEEFKNEMLFISKLQHKNLVRIAV